MTAVLIGDGKADDSDAIEALMCNEPVAFPEAAPYKVGKGEDGRIKITGGTFLCDRDDMRIGDGMVHFKNCNFLGGGMMLAMRRAGGYIEIPLN